MKNKVLCKKCLVLLDHYILLPTQKELKEKADLYFEFEEIKYGRRVGVIKFQIFIKELSNTSQNSEQTSLFEVKKSPPIQAQALNAPESSALNDLLLLVVEQHRNKKTVVAGITDALKKRGFEYVKRNILYSNEKAAKSYAGFLNNALKNDWGHDWQLEQQEAKEKKKVPEIWERQGFKTEKEYDEFRYKEQMQKYGKFV